MGNIFQTPEKRQADSSQIADQNKRVIQLPLTPTKTNIGHLIKVAGGVTKSAAMDQEKRIDPVNGFLAYLQDRIKLYGVSVKTEI